MKKNRSFTLIELLVVVAVIAIMAAMLLPALNKARETAKKAQCINNQKQFGLAFKMYGGDFDDYYPPWEKFGYGLDIYNWAWALRYGKYLTTPKSFQCPIADRYFSSPYVFGSHDVVHMPDTISSYQNIAYGTNNWFVTGMWGLYNDYRRSIPVKSSRIKKPSTCVVMCDSINMPNGQPISYVGGTPTFYASVHDRHAGGTVILWADGHVNHNVNAKGNIQSADYFYWKTDKNQ